jgi:signal transduction histidine kinase
VQVTVDGDDERLRLVVEDDGPGGSQAPGTRSGNDMLRQRLALLYGAAATFAAGPGQAGGYRVELSIPRAMLAAEPEPVVVELEVAAS